MIKEDSLHQLIRSLNSAEKRLFKISVANTSKGKENHYIELFNVLSKLKEYDEDKLRRKIKNQNSLKNLAQSKKYLKDLILRSMRNIDAETSEDKINNLLKEAAFLNKKNLFKEQWKKLEKAKSIATKFEYFNFILDVLDKQMKYLTEFDFDKAVKTKEEYKKEKLLVLNVLKTRESLIISRNVVFQILRKYKKIISLALKDELVEEISRFNEDEIIRQNSFVNSYHFFVLMSNYYKLIDEQNLTIKYRKKSLDLFRTYPHFKIKYNYLIVYFNYIGSLYKKGDFTALKKELDLIEKEELSNKNKQGEFFQNYALYRLLYLLNTGNLVEAYMLENSIEEGIDTFRSKINSSSLTTICYNYANVFFFNSDFENTLKWLDKIEKINSEVRLDIVSFSKVMDLICHYELNNIQLIESLVRSFRRTKNATEFEKLIANAILAMSKATKAKREGIIIKLKNTTTKLNEDQGDILGFSTLNIWMNSYIENKSVQVVYKKSLSSS